MNPPRASRSHASQVVPLGCGLLAFAIGLVGCGSIHNPNNAPAYGTIGGAGLGAAIGSASGSGLSGAFLGAFLGNAGGSIVRNENGPPSSADSRLLEDMPAALDEAEKYDKRITKEFPSLQEEITNAAPYERSIAVNRAKQRVAETKDWVRLAKQCENLASDAVSRENSFPTGRIGHWLKQRDRARTVKASLEQHQTWYEYLAR